MSLQSSLPIGSIQKGCILFLKRHGDVDKQLLVNYDIEPEAMFHPVIVLKVRKGSNEVVVCLLTTFNQRDVQDCHKPDYHHLYLAIYPKRPPRGGHPQLQLARNVLLRKPSYVNLRRCYLVHRDMLMLYNRHESASYFQLTPQSYAVVVKKLNFKFVEVGPAEIKKRAPKQPVEPRSSRPRITHYGDGLQRSKFGMENARCMLKDHGGILTGRATGNGRASNNDRMGA
ncbi:hypothetical protein MMC28_010068 [Mycoblastus sanguinarius]|nr:hypothetical protein [Mycoblastus sanguinarius]